MPSNNSWGDGEGAQGVANAQDLFDSLRGAASGLIAPDLARVSFHHPL